MTAEELFSAAIQMMQHTKKYAVELDVPLQLEDGSDTIGVFRLVLMQLGDSVLVKSTLDMGDDPDETRH